MFSSKSLMVRESELGYMNHGGALAVKLAPNVGLEASIHPIEGGSSRYLS